MWICRRFKIIKKNFLLILSRLGSHQNLTWERFIHIGSGFQDTDVWCNKQMDIECCTHDSLVYVGLCIFEVKGHANISGHWRPKWMIIWLWWPNDIRGPRGPKASWHLVYYVWLYIFLFLLFVTGDHCSCLSDDRFQPDTAIFKSDGSDVYAYILCTWWSGVVATKTGIKLPLDWNTYSILSCLG